MVQGKYSHRRSTRCLGRATLRPSISHYQGDRFSVKYLYITNYRENFYAL
ncbi:hypothetical protein PN450_11355 [Dolichospermum lemmermannii CS-548]|nr:MULTISPECIES: hypothetical protein [Dolichospermum]MDB9437377.1 hypothetical protein [Dolichospermum lemmermannii CS-548]